MDIFVLVLLILYLKDKSLTDFTDLFASNNFKKNDNIILKYFKNGWMQFTWSNSLDDQQFILNKINEVKDHFIAEINEREFMS